MTSNVYFTSQEWDEVMDRKCKCGHLLYQHAFTMHPRGGDDIMIRTSQCVMCKYDDEKKEYPCNEFHSA